MKTNKELKSLILSKNMLDYNCADIIAQALVHNSTLSEIDLSYNNLGDTGIAVLLNPISRQKLSSLNGITSSKLNMKIKYINLTNNNHTEEAMKHIYALLLANPHIIIDIDAPKNLGHHSNHHN